MPNLTEPIKLHRGHVPSVLSSVWGGAAGAADRCRLLVSASQLGQRQAYPSEHWWGRMAKWSLRSAFRHEQERVACKASEKANGYLRQSL